MAVAGTTVLGGRYTLLAVLGTGGMATVWRARDETLGRDVAVKVLNPQHAADAEFLDRFESEARHAAAVSHPRLVTVFDCGVESGTPFIVMELVAGRTLRQVLDDAGVLPPGQAVAIAAAVCEGLDAAHAAGLVHRDITPANIVLNGGAVKVLDFGIARADGTRAATAAGTVVGTAAYLSPEQASGRPADPAPTSTPSAACCSRCSPAGRRSPPTRRSGSPTGRSTTIPGCPRPGAPACPPSSTRSPPSCWPRTRHRGRPPPPRPGRGCCPSSRPSTAHRTAAPPCFPSRRERCRLPRAEAGGPVAPRRRSVPRSPRR